MVLDGPAARQWIGIPDFSRMAQRPIIGPHEKFHEAITSIVKKSLFSPRFFVLPDARADDDTHPHSYYQRLDD
jgi:hypothetical protein